MHETGHSEPVHWDSLRDGMGSRRWLQKGDTCTPMADSCQCMAAAAAAKSLQSCPTLYSLIDCSPSGSPIPGILQARTLEWVAISFSSAGKWSVKVNLFSHVQLLATAWTAAYQALSSMGFSRQEYWSGVPLPSLQCMAKSTEYSQVVHLQFKYIN